MQNFNAKSYFRELDTYLDLRDLSINTKKNYHSSLKAYLTWLSETLAVSPEEFIRRFLLHVLPDRFVRIRHYGLLSNRAKGKKMTLVRHLVGGVRMEPRFRDMTTLQMLQKLYNFDPGICRCCGGAHLKNTTLPSIPKLEERRIPLVVLRSRSLCGCMPRRFSLKIYDSA